MHSMKPGYVINPLTKREIAIGSTVYQKLVKKGVIQDGTGQYAPARSAPMQIPPNRFVQKSQIQDQYTEDSYQMPAALKRQPPVNRFMKASTPTPTVSKAYHNLGAQIKKSYYDPQEEEYEQRPQFMQSNRQPSATTPAKQKKTPKQKIDSIVSAGTEAYNRSVEALSHQQFETEDEMKSALRQSIIENLRKVNNKHVNKYLQE